LSNQRNLFLAVVLCGLLLFGWDAAINYIYPKPATPAKVEATTAATAEGDTKKVDPVCLWGDGQILAPGRSRARPKGGSALYASWPSIHPSMPRAC
jgi:hypothetical protein